MDLAGKSMRDAVQGDERASSSAWRFAQTLLGNPIPSANAAAATKRAERERLEWLASISTEHESQLRALLHEEANQHDGRRELAAFVESLTCVACEWDASKHPRGAFSQNKGWFSPTFGSARVDRNSATRRPDAVIRSGEIEVAVGGNVVADASVNVVRNSALRFGSSQLERLPPVQQPPNPTQTREDLWRNSWNEQQRRMQGKPNDTYQALIRFLTQMAQREGSQFVQKYLRDNSDLWPTLGIRPPARGQGRQPRGNITVTPIVGTPGRTSPDQPIIGIRIGVSW